MLTSIRFITKKTEDSIDICSIVFRLSLDTQNVRPAKTSAASGIHTARPFIVLIASKIVGRLETVASGIFRFRLLVSRLFTKPRPEDASELFRLLSTGSTFKITLSLSINITSPLAEGCDF